MTTYFNDLTDNQQRYVANLILHERGPLYGDVEDRYHEEIGDAEKLYYTKLRELRGRCATCDFYEYDEMEELFNTAEAGPSRVEVTASMTVKDGVLKGVYMDYTITCKVDYPKSTALEVKYVAIKNDADVIRIYNTFVPASAKKADDDEDDVYVKATDVIYEMLNSGNYKSGYVESVAKEYDLPELLKVYALLSEFADVVSFCIGVVHDFDSIEVAVDILSYENPDVSEYVDEDDDDDYEEEYEDEDDDDLLFG